MENNAITSLEAVNETTATRNIVRIGNIEMDVAVTSMRSIQTFKVGDPVKLLKKAGSYSSQETMAGVIVSFDNYESAPAIVVLAMTSSYNDVNFQFVTITEMGKEYDMIHYSGYEQLFTRDNVMRIFDRKVAEMELKINEMKAKRAYFDQHFASAFEKISRLEFKA